MKIRCFKKVAALALKLTSQISGSCYCIALLIEHSLKTCEVLCYLTTSWCFLVLAVVNSVEKLGRCEVPLSLYTAFLHVWCSFWFAFSHYSVLTIRYKCITQIRGSPTSLLHIWLILRLFSSGGFRLPKLLCWL